MSLIAKGQRHQWSESNDPNRESSHDRRSRCTQRRSFIQFRPSLPCASPTVIVVIIELGSIDTFPHSHLAEFTRCKRASRVTNLTTQANFRDSSYLESVSVERCMAALGTHHEPWDTRSDIGPARILTRSGSGAFLSARGETILETWTERTGSRPLIAPRHSDLEHHTKGAGFRSRGSLFFTVRYDSPQEGLPIPRSHLSPYVDESILFHDRPKCAYSAHRALILTFSRREKGRVLAIILISS